MPELPRPAAPARPRLRVVALAVLAVLAAGAPFVLPFLQNETGLFTVYDLDDAALPRAPVRSDLARKIVDGATRQIGVTRSYDARYVTLTYPEGDVPPGRGVCADVVVRALRAAGIDLQQDVHEDMALAFAVYPHLWGLKQPDSNIDHRRVPNLMTYFARRGESLPVTRRAADYQPGDVVAWRTPGGRYHTGVVSDRLSPDGTPLIVHNMGYGTQLQDVLFAWTVIGHYRMIES